MIAYRGIPAGYEDDDEEYNDNLDVLDCSARNLKITVVPDIIIGAGLDGKDFDSSLTADMAVWLEQFKETFSKCKRTPVTQHQIKLVLLRDPRPLHLALQLFARSPGCNYLKNKNMALFILESVCELYNLDPKIEATCDDNTRMVAFNFIKTCGIVPLYKAVTETYQLHKIKDYLIPQLHNLLSAGNYKDAANWSILLNVTHIFGLLDLIFPLFLQDKSPLAEDYLKEAQEQQLPTVQFLDSLLDRKKSVHENCDVILKKYKYSDVKNNILSYRPMSKLVTRLAKKYNIDSQHTPNLRYSKSCSYLHYLFHKYQDGGMSSESWRELAREEANKDRALQLDLVTRIASTDLKEAIYWVQLYKIEYDECPLALQMQMDEDNKRLLEPSNSNFTEQQDPNDSWDNTSGENLNDHNSKHQQPPASSIRSSRREMLVRDDFLKLQLPFAAIIVVDAKQKFLDMLAYLEAHAIIAFDSEWKPSVQNDNRVSLIQLATNERVYLVDCLTPCLDDSMWKLMGRKIFNNLEILKLGFSLHYDLQMLHKSLPLCLNLQATSCYLDLRDLWRRLKYMHITDFPFEHRTVAGESLCALTEMCLGKKLDKSNQCSNWANRPLRHDQIVYAALDAFCLLQIYQIFADILDRKGYDINALVDDISNSKSGRLFRIKQKTAPNSSGSSNSMDSNKTLQNYVSFNKKKSSNEPSIIYKAHQIKFICDTMLMGLAKELRKLGINCIEMKQTVDLSEYIVMARKDKNCFILSRDSRYLQIARELKHQQCMQIPSDSIEQQVVHILQYFNLEIDQRNLSSRCIHCNGNDFILANRYDMQLMRFGQTQQQSADNGSLPKYKAENKLWNLQKINQHILQSKQTFAGKSIKLNRLNPYILYTRNYFYICDNCGLCTWPGAFSLHQYIMDYIFPNAATANATCGNISVISSNTSELQ